MSDLAATNVTVALIKRGRIPGFANIGLCSLTFGNGALTVPAAGIPLPTDLRKFGVRTAIGFMQILQPPADGLVYRYDLSNHKLLILQSAAVTAHVHDLKFIGGITATEAVAIQGGDTLGKNAATDRTIAGSASATKGGVVSAGAVAAAALAAYTGAIASTVVVVMVYGN
jgi:hypothetical protein